MSTQIAIDHIVCKAVETGQILTFLKEPFVRSINRFKKTILFNHYCGTPFRYFYSLTVADKYYPEFAKNPGKFFRKFMNKLRNYCRRNIIPRFQYVARLERGSKHGRLHYHVLLTEKVCPLFLMSLWGLNTNPEAFNFQDITSQNVIPYVLKYMGKTVKGKEKSTRFFNLNKKLPSRRFYRSKGIHTPNHYIKPLKKPEYDMKTNRIREVMVGIETFPIGVRGQGFFIMQKPRFEFVGVCSIPRDQDRDPTQRVESLEFDPYPLILKAYSREQSAGLRNSSLDKIERKRAFFIKRGLMGKMQKKDLYVVPSLCKPHVKYLSYDLFIKYYKQVAYRADFQRKYFSIHKPHRKIVLNRRHTINHIVCDF